MSRVSGLCSLRMWSNTTCQPNFGAPELDVNSMIGKKVSCICPCDKCFDDLGDFFFPLTVVMAFLDIFGLKLLSKFGLLLLLRAIFCNPLSADGGLLPFACGRRDIKDCSPVFSAGGRFIIAKFTLNTEFLRPSDNI